MFEFGWPWASLLLPLPLLAWLFLKSSRKIHEEDAPTILFPYTNRLKQAFNDTQEIKQKDKTWFVVMLSLLWICLVLTLMHPQLIDRMNQANRKGYDIMLAVDISPSMTIADLVEGDKKLTRLDVTKTVVGNFINQRHGDRVGLIVFGQHAYLLAPMTYDSFALGKMLNQTLSGMAGMATAIGDAIGVAIRELRNRNSESRVLILLTDGSDTASNLPPLEAANIAAQYGIKIYTIGVGSNKMSVKLAAHMKEEINEELLKKIADVTGGQYFRATDDSSLEKIYSKINELEKIDLTIPEYWSQSLHRYPLGLACILFMILCLMPLLRQIQPNLKRRHGEST